MKSFVLLFLILFAGCREFYDEEFEEFEERRRSEGTDSNGNASYEVELQSTDQNVPDLRGDARIDISGENVTVDIDVDGIPANIINLHYSYISASCSELSISIPNDSTTTRTFTLQESTSLDALADDLSSSGASSSQGDTNLLGKSLVVKAFSNFSGIPNPNGTNQIIILCGQIVKRNSESSTTFDPTLPETTTGGTFDTSTGF